MKQPSESRAASTKIVRWRKRVGVEPTIRPAKDRIAGFEDREGHRTPFASDAARHHIIKFSQRMQPSRLPCLGTIVVSVAIRETTSCRLAIERCPCLPGIASVFWLSNSAMLPRGVPDCCNQLTKVRQLSGCSIVGNLSEEHRPETDFLRVCKTCLRHEAENSALGIVF
jgi:hypothetical protein